LKLISIINIGLFTIVMASCKKDPTPKEQPKAPVPAKIQAIVGKTWQVVEVNDLSNCTNTHYVRGGSGNTGANYDPVRFTFKADSTGTHTDTQGNTYPITWNFVAGDSQRIAIKVIASTPVTYQWNLVEVFGNKLIETTAIDAGSNHTLVSATYVPTTGSGTTTPALTATQMLTQKQWMVHEVYNNSSCTNSHYLFNGTANTGTNYSAVRFKFNPDGTGTYTDTEGRTFTISWAFTSPDETRLRITVNAPTPVIYNWNQFEISPGVMYQTTAIGSGGSDNVLVSARWITVP
jgi:hypothetical protein